jgi:hypothetical protein
VLPHHNPAGTPKTEWIPSEAVTDDKGISDCAPAPRIAPP